MGAAGVWYAIAFSNVASAVVAAAWFLRGTWAMSVVESNESIIESDEETADVLEPDDVPPERPAGGPACEADCVPEHVD